MSSAKVFITFTVRTAWGVMERDCTIVPRSIMYDRFSPGEGYQLVFLNTKTKETETVPMKDIVTWEELRTVTRHWTV